MRLVTVLGTNAAHRVACVGSVFSVGGRFGAKYSSPCRFLQSGRAPVPAVGQACASLFLGRGDPG